MTVRFATPDLPIDVATVKGFLDQEEGAALYAMAREAAARGPVVEIGSYCGKSTLYIGTACRVAGGTLFSVDHHRGSEENQPGWEYHDPDIWDSDAGAVDTLPFFRETLRRAGLEDSVVAVVGRSATVAAHWLAPISMLFIDGGHTLEAAMTDYRSWAPRIMPGGILAIHDIFPNPSDGGQAPYEVYRFATASGLFEELAMVKTLALLRRRVGEDVNEETVRTGDLSEGVRGN